MQISPTSFVQCPCAAGRSEAETTSTPFCESLAVVFLRVKKLFALRAVASRKLEKVHNSSRADRSGNGETREQENFYLFS
jgi:hypothetical protein